MKQGIARFICSIFLLLSPLVIADSAPVSIDLILPAENQALRKLAKQIDRSDTYQIKTHVKTLPPQEQRSDYLLVISDALLPLLAENSYQFSFALYVSQGQYQQAAQPNSSAVFSNQPLSRQLKLIQAIVKQKHLQVGVAYKHPSLKSEINQAASDFPWFSFNAQHIAQANPIREMNQLIQDSNILLSTGEAELYNAQTIRSILLSSYRHQTPVIGPNEGFVNAGALASVISTPEHYAKEIQHLIERTISKGRVQPPGYPSDFEVKINHHVASSMGIELPSETELAQAIGEL